MTHANLIRYSDVVPFEVTRKISEKTIEIREMDTVLLNPEELEFHSGGFCANCQNQYVQRYSYSSNQSNPIYRARLRKDGYFWSKLGRHQAKDYPIKFYDYNF